MISWLQATPEAKLKLIRDEQAKGKLVAMCGDGTNDAPRWPRPMSAWADDDTGTMAAREAGKHGGPRQAIRPSSSRLWRIGKQLLITRGALTTFSIAMTSPNISPSFRPMFLAFYPQLQALNIMQLHSPQSAILSAIIFNALIIIALIPAGPQGVSIAPSARQVCCAAIF